MKRKGLYILIGLLLLVGGVILFIYINGKKTSDDLYGFWTYKKYEIYENNKLLDKIENITSEYLNIDKDTIKYCIYELDNNSNCEEISYTKKGNKIITTSASLNLSGTFTYKINKNNLTLTKEENNNKYIYIYNRPSG